MKPRALPIVFLTIASWTACGRIGYDDIAGQDSPRTDTHAGGASPSGTGYGGTFGVSTDTVGGGAGVRSTGTTEGGSGGASSAGASGTTAASDGGGAPGGGGASGGGAPGGGGASGGGAPGGGGVAGKAGTGGVGGSGGATNLDLIDDLEDGNAAIRGVAQPARNGVWDTSNDMSAGGVQIPAPSMFAAVALGSAVPYAGDRYAAYTRGGGFTNYGAFMNVTMRSWPIYAQAPTYDASGYSGLSFWAKVGASSTKTLRVRFVSADTDDRGGRCSKTGPVDQVCYNHFYLDLPLAVSWQRHEIRFADFVQSNTGKIFPSIDLAEMYGLEFYFLSGTSFEVWVDDLSFIRR